MSDALLKEISAKLTDIHAALVKTGASPKAAAAVANAASNVNAAANAAAGNKPAAGNKGATGAGNKGATGAGNKNKNASAPVAGTKAANGKHTIEEVREILRDVATNKSLGRENALAILDENGGVDHLNKLKPENYDAVYEAAQVELDGVKEPAAAESGSEEDDGLGL